VLSAHIGNTYLHASMKERVHTICGPEFGPTLNDRIAVITCALFGLKSSGTAWRNLFAGTLSYLGNQSSLVDLDVWLHCAEKPNGIKYYVHIFLYVDDLLVLSEKPDQILRTIGNIYRLKENSVAKPTTYLGAVIKEHKLPDVPNKSVWSISADKYVKEAIRTIESDLLSMNMKLPANIHTPLVTSYRPDLDFSSPLEEDYANWYQQLIGILRWAVELGGIDIHLSVALLAQYLAQP